MSKQRLFHATFKKGNLTQNTNIIFFFFFYSKSKTQGAITEELAMVCSELWSGKYKSISPKCLRYAIGQQQKIFSGYDQQDSHEFLTIIIDILNSELQYPIQLVRSCSSFKILN